MNKNIINLLFLSVGILFGIVISAGRQYPLTAPELDKIKNVCKEQPLKRMKIDLVGKIRQLECANGIVYQLD